MTQNEDVDFKALQEAAGGPDVEEYEEPAQQTSPRDQPAQPQARAEQDFSPAKTVQEEDWLGEESEHIAASHSDEQLKEGKTQSMLRREECPVSKCTVKDENAQLNKRLTELQQELNKRTRENEEQRRILESQVSEEQRENILIRAYKEPEISKLQDTIRKRDARIQTLTSQLNEKEKKVRELEDEKQRYLTSVQLDRKYREKYEQMRGMEQRVNLLQNQEDELKARKESIETKHDKLVEAYNDLVRRYQNLKTRMKNLRAIEKHGIKLKEEPQNGKKPFLKRLLPRWSP